jgi:hypothetical protein
MNLKATVSLISLEVSDTLITFRNMIFKCQIEVLYLCDLSYDSVFYIFEYSLSNIIIEADHDMFLWN